MKSFENLAELLEGNFVKEDQFPSDKSRQASSKLKHQVHKATVAAGKEPKLTLGTIGLSIGQKQSTGDTSKVSEAFAQPTETMSRTLKDKLNNSAEGKPKEEPSTGVNVKDVIRRVKISLLSAKDTESLLKELGSYKQNRVLALKDIDQLAVIADVDVKKLRKVAGI